MRVAERVYTDLRSAIVDGGYRPHQRLVETELAAELHASRTPVRQALQRLELEGLVRASRHGWVVHDHSLVEIKAIYDVRISLEGYASRLAAERASKDDLETMRKLHAALLDHLSPAHRAEFVKLHDQFHESIVHSAHNAVLSDAVNQFRRHPFNRRVAHSYTEDEMRGAVDSHEQMLAAVVARNPDQAEELTRKHLEMSRAVTLNRLKGSFA